MRRLGKYLDIGVFGYFFLLDNEALVNEIASIITNARIIKNINTELINAYWNIGRIIVEDAKYEIALFKISKFPDTV